MILTLQIITIVAGLAGGYFVWLTVGFATKDLSEKQEKFSWRPRFFSKDFLLLELTTLILFITVFLFNSPVKFDAIDLIKYFGQLFFVGALELIFLIDLKYQLILDKIIYPLIPAVFLLNLYLGDWRISAAADLLIAGVIGWVFFAAQYYFSKGKWVGGGDQKFGALLGVMLGVKGLLLTLAIAYIGGAVVGIFLVFLKRKNLKSHLPLAVFLAPAAVISLLFGEVILRFLLKY